MATPKIVKCNGCGKEKKFTFNTPCMPSEYTVDEKQDVDGIPIFMCGGIKGCRFKINPIDYMKNRENENYIVKTVDADLDFSDWDYENLPTKKIQRSIFKKAKNFLGM